MGLGCCWILCCCILFWEGVIVLICAVFRGIQPSVYYPWLMQRSGPREEIHHRSSGSEKNTQIHQAKENKVWILHFCFICWAASICAIYDCVPPGVSGWERYRGQNPIQWWILHRNTNAQFTLKQLQSIIKCKLYFSDYLLLIVQNKNTHKCWIL